MLKHLFNNEHPVLTAKHPLLEEVWITLEKLHSSDNRQQIYDKIKGPLIPKRTCETYKYHTKGSEEPLFKRIRFECNNEIETQMERFLRDIYNTEEHYASRVQMREAIDSVCALRKTLGTKIIGVKLQKSLDYLQDKFADIGLFEIVPNIKNHKSITFTNFNSFKDAFLKHAKKALKMEEIPTFSFGSTGYINAINEIKNTADWILRCFVEEKYFGLNFEMTLSAVYDYARSFERIHSEPFTSMITASARCRTGGSTAINKINSKKAINYDLLRSQVNIYVKTHKKNSCRSINQAAKELARRKGFPCSKIIKIKFKEELEPMRATRRIKGKGKI